MGHKDVLSAVEGLCNQPNAIHLKSEESRRMAKGFGTRNLFWNYNFIPTVKNRIAGLMVYVGSQKVIECNLNQRENSKC
ncbi:MAG: hypothetical protein H3Z52_10645 [archaeon]|nr:hypothetical protein [archaeon]MCP8321378.1 hypothetical protein [archaeon]